MVVKLANWGAKVQILVRAQETGAPGRGACWRRGRPGLQLVLGQLLQGHNTAQSGKGGARSTKGSAPASAGSHHVSSVPTKPEIPGTVPGICDWLSGKTVYKFQTEGGDA